MAKAKAKEKTAMVFNSDEEKYEYAKTLTESAKCLLRDKEKAEIYEAIAKFFEELGEYEDSQQLCEEYKKKAEPFRKKVKEQQAQNKKKKQEEEENKGLSTTRKVVYAVIAIVLVVGIVGAVYLKTVPGRYARASFFEKIGKYEKSYKMFYNLGDYKDSESRYQESKYEYGIQKKKSNDYENAKNALRDIEDYKDSKAQLTNLELKNIKNSEIGDSVLYGQYKWLIVDKKGSKFLMVKSEPVSGYPYNDRDVDVTWEESTIRTFLNSYFMDVAFYPEMKETFVDTKITVADNEKYNTKGGKSTTDKIFLLNANQAEKYKSMLSNFLRDWWLIGPGGNQNTAQFVSYGNVMDYGYCVNTTKINIRPAFWLETKKK